MGRIPTNPQSAVYLERRAYYQANRTRISAQCKAHYAKHKEFTQKCWRRINELKRALKGQAKENLEDAVMLALNQEFEMLGGNLDRLPYHQPSIKEKAAYVRKYKEVHDVCSDCGGKFPYFVLDFDHVRGRKVDSISNLVAKKISLKTVQKEIEKCDVVCANCHRRRTFKSVSPHCHTSTQESHLIP